MIKLEHVLHVGLTPDSKKTISIYYDSIINQFKHPKSNFREKKKQTKTLFNYLSVSQTSFRMLQGLVPQTNIDWKCSSTDKCEILNIENQFWITQRKLLYHTTETYSRLYFLNANFEPNGLLTWGRRVWSRGRNLPRDMDYHKPEVKRFSNTRFFRKISHVQTWNLRK